MRLEEKEGDGKEQGKSQSKLSLRGAGPTSQSLECLKIQNLSLINGHSKVTAEREDSL